LARQHELSGALRKTNLLIYAGTKHNLIHSFRRTADLLNAAAKLPDSILDQTINGKDYYYRFLLRETVSHKVYHSGQIALLKKAFAD
jgi:hypothetical protein